MDVNNNTSKYCLKGCGFFGNDAFKGHCSKCFKEMEADKSTDERGSPPPSSPVRKTIPDVKPLKQDKDTTIPESIGSECSKKTEKTENEIAEQDKSSPPKISIKSRCATCNKKVGVMGVQCRCKKIICIEHRGPEGHDCSYDYKSRKEDLAVMLKKVAPAKMEHF